MTEKTIADNGKSMDDDALELKSTAHLLPVNPSNKTQDGVDYEFWVALSGWNVEEASALLLGIDPDRLEPPPHVLGGPAWRRERLMRQLVRAVEMDELESPMVPREFLAWALSNRIAPPEELRRQIKSGRPLRNWRTRYHKTKKQRDKLRAEIASLRERNAEDINPKSKASLLSLMGAMARKHYRHQKGNRQTVGMIAKTLDEYGRHLTLNTIKNHLDASDDLWEDV